MKLLITNRLCFLLLLAASLVFTSCVEDSADVNQDKIYTDYEVFYNSNTDKTWVVARFRFGGAAGTLLQLNDPANVTFNGEELPWSNIFLGHFREYAGQLTEGTFVYTNTLGETFTNSLPAFESIEFPATLDTLPKSQAYNLAWDGSPLAANQYVGLFAGSWTWGDDALFFQDTDGAQEIILGTTGLGNLPAGTSTLFMDRSTDLPVSEGTSEGGRIRGKFRATNKVVTVVE